MRRTGVSVLVDVAAQTTNGLAIVVSIVSVRLEAAQSLVFVVVIVEVAVMSEAEAAAGVTPIKRKRS